MKLEKDKILHILVGAAIAVALGFINPVLGLLVSIAAGYLKEEWDAKHPKAHTYDGWDAYATGIGAVLGYCVHLVLLGSGLWSPLWP